MRAYHYLPFAALLSMMLVASAFAQSGIRWTNNLQEAQQIAQRDGRLVLMHFYADWCGPCRKLEHDVFPRTDVAASMMKNYVPVLIDKDRFGEIAAHYKVDRIPMDVITDASGRVVYGFSTPQDPTRYIQMLNGIASDHRFATPGYAVASRETGQNPGRTTGDTYQTARPQNQTQQRQFAQSAPPANQHSYGQGYGGSMPSNSASFGAGRGHEYGGVPNQPARESEYGPRYAGPSPNVTQTPRETYNPHVAPPNGGIPGDTRARTSLHQGPCNTPNPNDYGGNYQPPAPSRTSGWQTGPSQYAERGMQPNNSNTTVQPANPGRSMPEGHQPPRFTSTPVTSRPQESTLALDGFCPVTLAANEKWQQGDPQWGAIHRGRTYLFTSQRSQKMFLADPDRYSPMLSGYDPVRYIERGEKVPGLRKHGMWFNGKMYLFADELSLDRFWGSPEYFSQKSHESMMSAGR